MGGGSSMKGRRGEDGSGVLGMCGPGSGIRSSAGIPDWSR